MDYESIKAMIVARLNSKKWQENKEAMNALYPASIGDSEVVGTDIPSAFVRAILMDLKTAYDIQEAQRHS